MLLAYPGAVVLLDLRTKRRGANMRVMWRRLIVPAGVLAVLASIMLSTGVASAGNGAATPFKATYIDNSFRALATCSGARVIQGNGLVKDSETCILSGNTTTVRAGTVVGNPTYSFPRIPGQVVEWASDFNNEIATNVTFRFVANGDGTFTEYIVAYY
jgi:hypothetical protein